MIASRVPAIPASIAALIMLAGLGLVYFALSGLGLIVPKGTVAGTASGLIGTGNASGSISESIGAATGKPGASSGEGPNAP